MSATAITDIEELQTGANWSTGNFFTDVSIRPSPLAVEFIGTQVACYYYALSVPAGSGDTTVITQPLRWSLNEPSVSGDGMEVFQRGNLTTMALGAYEYGPNESWRTSVFQAFASNEFLPASGNSHASATDPYMTVFNNWPFTSVSHVSWLHGTTDLRAGGLLILTPPKWYITARYVQYRINGTAAGPVHDLKDMFIAASPNGNLIDGVWGPGGPKNNTVWNQPFPSGHPYWTYYQSYLENWNLEFTDGDDIEVDVWYEIGARAGIANRTLCLSFGRYATNNNQQINNQSPATPTSGYIVRKRDAFLPGLLSLYGIDMSPGFDPATHTYQFDPQDGSFTFGKAQAASAIRFAVTSKSLEWEFHESQASSCGTSLWEWQEDFSTNPTTLKWVLLTNDCTDGGTPVEPNYNPIDIGTQDTTSCQCPVGAGSIWYFFINLVYQDEMVYLRLFGRRTSPAAEFTTYYRPESSEDYVDEVNDRWEGTMKTGPTGVFDHMGATTFKHWRGIQQTSGAYDASIPSQYSAIASLIPTEILVTKVAQ